MSGLAAERSFVVRGVITLAALFTRIAAVGGGGLEGGRRCQGGSCAELDRGLV